MMDVLIIAIFLLFGIILLLAEIFLLPGISIAGIGGIIFFAGAIIYAFTIDTMWGIVTVGISVVALGLAIYYFMRSRMLDKMSLHTEIDGKFETFDEKSIQVGDKGVSISRLAPMGKAKINNIVLEAKSLYDFIDEDQEIEVVQVNKTNVVVKLAEKEKDAQ